MPALFYSLKTAGDVLYVVISPESIPDKVVKLNNLAALYKGEKLVGINILDFSKLAKIHSVGRIVKLPEPMQILINNALSNANLSPLDFNEPSGFEVVEVSALEEHPLDEKKSIATMSSKDGVLITSTRYQNLHVGDKLVVIKDKAIRFDGTSFRKAVIRNINQDCEICSPSDLGLGEEAKAAYIESSKAVGEDFFA